MTERRLTVIALTGATGSGKDTLAAELVADYGYTKLSFGAVLRAKVVDDFGECHDERDLTYCPYGSFKDAMLCYGKTLALKGPADLSYLMTLQLQTHIAEQDYDCPVVITDLRKPIELDTLLHTPGLNLWLIEITRKDNPYKPKRLDNLLSGHLASQRYADAKLKRERLVQPSAIENDGSPADMVDRLSLILELTLPYRTGA